MALCDVNGRNLQRAAEQPSKGPDLHAIFASFTMSPATSTPSIVSTTEHTHAFRHAACSPAGQARLL